MTVVDNNILSVLAKIERLGLLKTVFDDVATTPGVVEELDTARLEGYRFVDRIEAARTDGWLTVLTPSREEIDRAEAIRDGTLSFVDAECLALAESRDRRLLTDDRHVGTVGKNVGVEVWDLPLLFQACIVKGEIRSESELETIVHDLEARDSYRLATDDKQQLYETVR